MNDQRPAAIDDGLQKSQYVYLYLRERILLGQYAPGQTILQAALTSYFGFSKVPIATAVKMLIDEGYIVQKRWVETTVRNWLPDDFTDLAALRASILSLAADRAAKRASPESIATLRRLLEFQPRAFDKLNPAQSEQYYNRYSLFLQTLAEISEIPNATAILLQLFPHALQRITLRSYSPFDAQKAFKSFGEVVDQIENQEAGAASALLRTQLERGNALALPSIQALHALVRSNEVKLDEPALARPQYLAANLKALPFGRGDYDIASAEEFMRLIDVRTTTDISATAGKPQSKNQFNSVR